MTKPIRVLAVDDSAAMRDILERLLTAAGYQVATAADAHDGLRRLPALQPHIILTDYNMPGLDGHDFVQLIRRDPMFRATPVFVVSSEDAWEKRWLMDQAGASGWFRKPIDPAVLIGALEAAAQSLDPPESALRSCIQARPSSVRAA